MCDRERVARILGAQLGFTFDIDKVYRHVKKHAFTQLNKGVVDRYKDELSENDAAILKESFAAFIRLVASFENQE